MTKVNKRTAWVKEKYFDDIFLVVSYVCLTENFRDPGQYPNSQSKW